MTRSADRRRPPAGRPLAPLALPGMLAVVLATAGACAVLPRPVAGQRPPPVTPDLWPSSLPVSGAPWLDLLYRVDPGDGGGSDLASARVGVGYGGFLWLTGHYGHVSGVDLEDEWEVAARLVPLSTSAGAAIEVALTAGWNEAAGSADGELMIGYPVDPRLLLRGAIRRFSDQLHDEDGGWAAGAGATGLVHPGFHVGADVVVAQDVGDVVWGVSLAADVPRTPVSLALEVGNGRSTTLQGSTTPGPERVGLRVRAPLDPRAWIRAAGSGGDGPRVGESDLIAADTVEVVMGAADGAIFSPQRVTVAPGTYVRWRNESGGVHSAVAADDAWASPLLAPGESYGRVFTAPGEQAYRCQLHPEETGVVTVEGGGA